MTSTRRGWLRGLFGPPPLRPPGARAEAAFAALCIRCSRCVEVCPYGSLKPAPWTFGPDAGTPLVEAAEVPCYLCMECPPACPTGALEPITDKRRVRMGKAVVDEAACFAFQGVLCRTCVDECPLTGDAIRQDGLLRPVVTAACVGCGVCEARCPARVRQDGLFAGLGGTAEGETGRPAGEAAIRVVPAALLPRGARREGEVAS